MLFTFKIPNSYKLKKNLNTFSLTVNWIEFLSTDQIDLINNLFSVICSIQENYKTTSMQIAIIVHQIIENI